MTDRLITARADQVSGKEFFDAVFKRRTDPAQARLNIKFAQAFNLPIDPEWVEAAKEDQLTEPTQGDPLLPENRRDAA